MKSRVLFLSVLLVLVSGQVFACSIHGYDSFVPDVVNFESKFENDETAAILPAPTSKLVHVKRGTAAAGASCDDAGVIEVQLTWPDSSKYRLEEIGFYFRVVSGESPDLIFPLGPVTGRIEADAMTFAFAWLDGHPSKQLPLDLRVEVFAVNRGLEIGRSAFFVVKRGRG